MPPKAKFTREEIQSMEEVQEEVRGAAMKVFEARVEEAYALFQ